MALTVIVVAETVTVIAVVVLAIVRKEMHPDDRPVDFIPRKFKSLRHVPLYSEFIKERFNRCLDLYLCPRAIKRKLQIDPDTLLPKLPDPKELRPFPTTMAIQVGFAVLLARRSSVFRVPSFSGGLLRAVLNSRHMTWRL